MVEYFTFIKLWRCISRNYNSRIIIVFNHIIMNFRFYNLRSTIAIYK